MGGALFRTSTPSFLGHKVFRPSQGFCDVITGPCSLGNQGGAPSAPPEITTHSHRPIRSRQGRRVLQRRELSAVVQSAAAIPCEIEEGGGTTLGT